MPTENPLRMVLSPADTDGTATRSNSIVRQRDLTHSAARPKLDPIPSRRRAWIRMIVQPLGDPLAFATSLIFRLVAFAVAFGFISAIGRFVVEPVVKRVLQARDVDLTVSRPVVRIVHILVLFVAFVFGLSAAGLGGLLSASATLLAALTLAIGIASQDLMANLVSGAFIITDRTFEIGDWIKWEDNEGIVEDIGFRVTRVRTFDNELLSVPNSTLTGTDVINPVQGGRLRITYPFKVSTDSDLDRVSEILVTTASEHPDILASPEPSTRVTIFEASFLEVQVRFWIADPDRTDFVRIRSEYITAVKERFDKAGIELSG